MLRGGWSLAAHSRSAAARIGVVLLAIAGGLAGGSTTSGSASVPVHPIRVVVGLGDSVPAGTACGHCTTYITLVAQSLSRTERVPVHDLNVSRPGQTSAGLLAQLREPATRRALQAADLVIVTIGANDFPASSVTSVACTSAASSCYQRQLTRLGARLTDAARAIRRLLPTARSRILLTGYWNVFRDGIVGRAQGSAYVRNSDQLTRAVNHVVANVAKAERDTYVDLYAPFKGDGDQDDTLLLARDGDHPNAAGHRAIAGAVVAALRR